jgi:hypothetical protein
MTIFHLRAVESLDENPVFPQSICGHTQENGGVPIANHRSCVWMPTYELWIHENGVPQTV